MSKLVLLDRTIQLLASAAIGSILVITLAQIVLRYGFSIALPWSADAAQVLLVYTVMLVAGYAVGKGSHFALPMLVDAMPPALRRHMPMLHSLLLLAFSVTMIVFGIRLGLSQMGTRLPALGLPVGMVYMALPLGAALMSAYAVAGLVSGPARNVAEGTPT